MKCHLCGGDRECSPNISCVHAHFPASPAAGSRPCNKVGPVGCGRKVMCHCQSKALKNVYSSISPASSGDHGGLMLRHGITKWAEPAL